MLKDSHSEYGWISIALHWIFGIAVITLFVLGHKAGDVKEAMMQMRELMAGDTEQVIKDALAPLIAERRRLMFLHVSVGMLAFLPIAFRIYWRISSGQKESLPQAEFFMLLARWVPRLLLTGVAIMMITGPLMVWTNGYSWTFFGLFAIPSPTGKMPGLHDALVPVHIYTANSLFVLFALHILGVLKHLIINRDRTLLRMLRPRRD